MLPENFDFEASNVALIKKLGRDKYLKRVKEQMDLLDWTKEEKFDVYYRLRKTLNKYAA